MKETLRPADAGEVAALVAEACAQGRTLDIVAGGSKRALGQGWCGERELDVSALAGVIDYDPSELVLTAHAATPLATIEALLEGGGQMLSFEPPALAPLLGNTGAPTLGGTIACNVAGPRRVRAGAARDHVLGFSAVNGRGEVWQAGGRVVKNVTGYDMGKLQAGAHGTLSVLTQLSVRVMPRPETSASLLFAGLDEAEAVVLMARALNTPHEVSAVAHGVDPVSRRPMTALRLEGPAPSVAYRIDALRTLGSCAVLAQAESARLWAEIGAVLPWLPEPRLLWRVCPPPAEAAAFLARLRRSLRADALLDWGGGLVWVSLDPVQAGADGGAGAVREALRLAGGHATLVLAPAEVRARVPVFQPLPGPLAALTARVKAAFDPAGVLNPGRLSYDFWPPPPEPE